MATATEIIQCHLQGFRVMPMTYMRDIHRRPDRLIGIATSFAAHQAIILDGVSAAKL